jgi:hypothetical protein
MGSASDKNVNSCPRIHRTSPSLALNLSADVVCTNKRKKKRRGSASHESIKI